MSKQLPPKMTEDQIKYWIANTNLAREELIQWYDSFVGKSKRTDKLSKADFNDLVNKLNVKNTNSATLNEYIFEGID